MAQALELALRQFAQSPSEKTLKSAREAWCAARIPYQQTEAFRFYAGPIDDADGPEPMINGWPLDEYHIDYVEGAPQSGIINDPKLFPDVSKDLIERMNERAGETAITSGFHAIEFLLWGQDFSEAGPGDRPFTDYTSAASADRRAAYLLACGDSLTDQLSHLVEEWSPDRKGNFRSDFEARAPRKAARDLIYGLHVMSGKELAGERLLVAWDTQDQEDEHSCFSDTTHLDVQNDALGIENVFLGRYVTVSGEKVTGIGLKALVKALLPDVADEMERKIKEARKAISQIPAPFDQAILGEDDATGRVTILEAVSHLEDFSDMMLQLEQALLAAP